MMRVSELIAHLQNLPPDALVVTEGYEDGYDTIKKIASIRVTENPKKIWYLGQYMDTAEREGNLAVFLDAQTKAEK